MTIWFITRSYPPQKGGGPQMRELQVEFLRKYYDVKVITINHDSNELIEENNNIYFPFLYSKWIKRLFILLDMLGFIEDYYLVWIKNVVKYLKLNTSDDDIVFSTTGGEIACMCIGNKIKKFNPKIKHIINFHDIPINCIYNNEKSNKYYHVNIEHVEKDCIENADFILTSSDNMTNQIVVKYPIVENKIEKLYFGFKDTSLNIHIGKKHDNYINIIHIGSVGPFQSPEIILSAFDKLDIKYKKLIKITFIGDVKSNKLIKENEYVKILDYMPRDKMIDYVKSEADFCFISLINKDMFCSAMPTKFYEYISLGKPIIGALPRNSEVMNIIKSHNLGYVCNYGEIEALTNILRNITITFKSKEYENIKNNIFKVQGIFNSNITLKTMYDIIESIKTK